MASGHVSVDWHIFLNANKVLLDVFRFTATLNVLLDATSENHHIFFISEPCVNFTRFLPVKFTKYFFPLYSNKVPMSSCVS